MKVVIDVLCLNSAFIGLCLVWQIIVVYLHHGGNFVDCPRGRKRYKWGKCEYFVDLDEERIDLTCF